MLHRITVFIASVFSLTVSAQWTVLDPNTNEDVRSVHFRSNGNAWLGGFDTLQWSVNSGDQFTERPTMVLGNVPLYGLYLTVFAFDNNTALISGTMNTGIAESIYRTTDGGITWTQVHYDDFGPIDVLRDIEFAQPPLGFAVGSNGRILRSTDSGLSWSAIPTGSNLTFNRVAWTGGSTYIASGPSNFMRSTDAGMNWVVVTGPDGATDVSCVGNVCHATSEGSIWRSTDAGLTWQISGQAMGAVLEMIDATTLINANDTGIFRTTTSGLYWEQLVTPGYQPLFQIDFYDATNGMAVGENGYVIRTGNAGGSGLPIASIQAPTGTFCTGSPVVFDNLGDSANDYEWRVDGASVSTSVQLTYTFLTEGIHLVELEADNGNGTHVATLSVNVLAYPTVVPFTASASLDTLCNGSSTTISVPTSQSSTYYRLLRGSVQQGSGSQGGTALSFATGAITEPTVFTVMGTRSNACGADTFLVDVEVLAPFVPPSTSWSFVEPEGCAPHTPIVRIQNAMAGFQYKVNSQQPVLGNGGVLDIPMPMVTGNATVTATVRMFFAGHTCTGVVIQSAQSIQVYQVATGFFINQDPGGDPQYALVDQPRTITLNANAALGYGWDFGSDASPATYQGQPPPPFQYATSGVKTVTLITNTPLGSCGDTSTQMITVVDSVGFVNVPTCNDGFAPADAYIADMCLDAYNNRYITGYYQTPGSGSQNAFFAMKVDSTGQEVWRYEGPSSGNWQSHGSYGYGIAADRAGNAYITGRFDHEDRTIAGVSIYQPNFLVKMDPSGALEWQITSLTNRFRGVVCSDDDVVHVVGYNSFFGLDLFLPSSERDVTAFPPNDPQRGNLFMLDIRPDGSLIDKQMFGQCASPSDPDTWQTMNVNSDALDTDDRYRCDPILRQDPNGGLLIAGIMHALPDETTCDFQGVTMDSYVPGSSLTNTRQVYVLQYMPEQGVTHAYALAGGKPQTVQGVSRSASGQYLVCGRFKSPFLFNGEDIQPEQPNLQTPKYFSYMISADADGEPLWQGTSPSRTTRFNDVAFSPDGTVYALVGYGATGMLPAGNGTYVGAGSGDQNLEYAFAHYTASGTLLGIDRSPTGSGVAFNLRPDACGNLHVVALQAEAAAYSEHGWVSCGGCPDNLRTTVISAAGCAPGCFAANIPNLRDVAMEVISLNDSNSQAPTVRVSFRNRGQVQADEIVIGFRVNEGPVQTIEWSGGLNYAEQVLDLAIGSLSFAGRHSNRVVAWVDLVNGSPDDLQTNDTLDLSHVLCFEPLHGTYSCGGEGDDFHTFNEVTKALEECGVNGPTTISIADGHYYEQLHVRSIPGASPTDTVVFTSASSDSAAVWLHFMPGTSSQYNAVVYLDDSCKYISITDLSLSHRVPGPSNQGIFVGLYGHAINVFRNHIVGNPNDDDQLGIWIRPNVGGDFRIEENRVDYGASGIGFNGSSSYVFGRCTVIGNSMINQSRRSLYGIFIGELTVVGNTIISDDAYNGSLYEAALLYPGAAPFRFDENYIRVATSAQVNTNEGVGNLVRLCFSNNSSTRGSMANNMIFNPLATGPNVIPAVGIDCGKVDVLHNTFGGITQISVTEGVVVQNNIFYNDEAVFALDFYGDVAPSMISDNNVFSAGPNGDYPAIIRYQGTGKSLGQWRTLTGLDLASTQVLPEFVSPVDLHLTDNNSFLCPSILSVTADIDGDPRNPIVTRQGADEEELFTGIDVPVEMSGLSIVPNPSVGPAMLHFPVADEVQDLRVINAVGQLVYQAQVRPGQSRVFLEQRPTSSVYHVVLSTRMKEVGRITWVVADE